MQYKTVFRSLLFISLAYSQILWNEPPDTIWYANQSRWVEVILPRPAPLKAETVNQNQVKLKIEQYWTDSFRSAYINKFGYEAIPNRHSLYKNGNALSGVLITDTEYIDNTTVKGETYYYEYLASDDNYIYIGELQHWSPRSYPTFITVGESLSLLSYPSNFKGNYNPYQKSIDLNWDSVDRVTSYTIIKSRYNTLSQQWEYYDFQNITENKYQDTDIEEYTEYLYSIKSVSGNDHSGRSPPIVISTPSFAFGAPSSFKGYFIRNLSSIKLTWGAVSGADSYQIFKSYIVPTTNAWQYLTIDVDNTTEYIDTNLLPFQTYFYQILAKSGSIKSARSTTIMVTTGKLETKNNIVDNFRLKQNAPNPFNPYTRIDYSIPLDAHVKIVVYNILGEEVKSLVNNYQLSGNHFIDWDGTDNNKELVVGGIYFYTIEAGVFNKTKKMIYLK